ncbi:MAG: DUF4412 domain-containing protein [Planctomycetota bacterium]
MRIIATLALVSFLSLTAAEPAVATKPAGPGIAFPAEYACTMSMTKDGTAMTIKMFRGKGGLTRMETKAEGQEVIIIVKPEQKQMHMLMVGMKMAMTQPLSDTAGPMKDPTTDPAATWKKVGAETINKIACDKYEYTSKSGNGVAWIDGTRNVLIRVQGGGKSETADFSDYTIGAQKADLFEVPAGYQSMGAPGGMPGGK